MRRFFVCALALAAVASASATVQVFFTNNMSGPNGLSNPDLAFSPTFAVPADPNNAPSFGDDYTHYSLANTNAPAFGNTTADASAGEWLYIWLKFSGAPANAQIQGLHLNIEPANKVQQVAYYLMDNEGLDGANELRWNGDPAAFSANPTILAAVTAKGLKNSAGGALINDPLWMGGPNSAPIRTALIGAVKMGVPGGEADYMATIGLGDLGIQYADGSEPPTAFGSAVITPEPASLLLIGLAGLLIRRR